MKNSTLASTILATCSLLSLPVFAQQTAPAVQPPADHMPNFAEVDDLFYLSVTNPRFNNIKERLNGFYSPAYPFTNIETPVRSAQFDFHCPVPLQALQPFANIYLTSGFANDFNPTCMGPQYNMALAREWHNEGDLANEWLVWFELARDQIRGLVSNQLQDESGVGCLRVVVNQDGKVIEVTDYDSPSRPYPYLPLNPKIQTKLREGLDMTDMFTRLPDKSQFKRIAVLIVGTAR